jgi:SAM-dependent methyltransferase
MHPDVHEQMAQTQDHHWWFSARRQVLGAVLNRLDLPRAARIAELGCGSGGNLALLARFGTLEAVELDDGARQRAAALQLCPVHAGHLPDAVPLAAHSFDLVCLLDVLEHVADDEAALRRVAQLLAPGGRALITVPAYGWLWSGHDEAHHHHRRYTAGALRSLAEQAGLVVHRLGYFNSLLFPLIAATRLGSKVLGRRDGSDAALPAPAINAALRAVFGFERHVAPHCLFPAGTSVLAVLGRQP